MANQFTLFKSRRFTPMFLTQFLGAFNDNVFKQALILVLTYTAASQLGLSESLLNNLAAMLFILPFFLFSATAGQVADKFEKSQLTQWIKILEIIIMTLAAIGFVFEWYIVLFIALFLMGTHSTFFGPIKYAYLPQALHPDELVGGNGLFQMGTSLAILTGMMLAGLLVSLEHSLNWISGIIVAISILGYVAARFVPTTPATDSNLTINFNILATSYQTIKFAYAIPALFYAILGVSWFWFYGATFLTQTPEFTKVILLGDEGVVILLLGLFSVGVAIGSLLCKSLTKNEVSLKLLPFGVFGLSLFAIDLYFALSTLNLPLLEQHLSKDTLFTVPQLLGNLGYFRVFIDLFLLGLSGGIYIVPLYAFMQAYAPASHRARVIAANNIFNALFMVISALFAMLVLVVLKLSLPTLFVLAAALNLLVGMLVFLQIKKYSQKITRHDNDGIVL